jgi:hypothetical protein
LKNFQYSGESTLSGSTFYRWTLSGENYYATEDAARIPRRVDEGTYALDFIMNTYSTDQIDDSVFAVPTGCATPCPKNTGCPGAFEGESEPKSLRQALFGKRLLNNLRK